MSKQTQHHYFVSTAFFWAIGATRKEAIAKVAKRFTAEELRLQKKANGGLYIWSCRVELPIEAHYPINNFAPQVNVDEISETREFRLVGRDGSVMVED